MTEEEINSLWFQSKVLDPSDRKWVRVQLQAAIAKKWPKAFFKKVQVKIPHWDGMDRLAVKRVMADTINSLPDGTMPECLKKWHASNIKVTITKHDSIADMLVNTSAWARNPQWFEGPCKCDHIQASLRASGLAPLPMVDGHICAMGKEYEGRNAHVFRQNNKNNGAATPQKCNTALAG